MTDALEPTTEGRAGANYGKDALEPTTEGREEPTFKSILRALTKKHLSCISTTNKNMLLGRTRNTKQLRKL